MKIVIALGGNALGNTPLEQEALIRNAIDNIIPLIKDNHQIVLAHGNGPQVGIINLAFTNSSSNDLSIPYMPFSECTAMSQGYIGYHIQKNMRLKLKEANLNNKVVSIVSEVIVDENDPSFSNPTKPVGPFYTEVEANKLASETGDKYIEDSGRGFRKVVASPKPIDIVQIDSIKELLNFNHIVIAGGGGGIPVSKDSYDKVLSGVIDKDLTSELIAEKINADRFIILTNVKQVELNYNTEHAPKLGTITTTEAKNYIKDNHFAPGSMLPKVEACIKFAETMNKEAIITSLDNLSNAINHINCTIIKKGN